MKKCFAAVMLFCATLFCGAFLTACGNSYKISISVPTAEEELYDIVLKAGNHTLQTDDGVYEVGAESNIKVEIVAKGHGVDFSDFVAKSGNIEKAIIKNSNYSPVPEQGELMYGYFTLAHVNSNMQLSFSGAKVKQTVFTFETTNFDDTQDLLSLASINFGTDTEYKNLKEFLQTENPSFVRNMNSTESFNTFTMKFEGVNSLDISYQKPFKIKEEGGTYQDVESVTLQDNAYVVDLGELGEAAIYTILVDFSQVNYRDFVFIKPQENLTYSIDLESETTNYSLSQNITVNKLSQTADYTDMALYCNSTELEIVSFDDTKVVYAFPKNSTPFIMGGYEAYNLYADGIIFDAPKRVLTANSHESNFENQLIRFQFYHISDDGQYQAVTSINKIGEAIGLQGEKVALTWNYEYNQGYFSKYDLANYDLMLNGQKILNVKELVNDKSESFEIDLEGGKFKAVFNNLTSKFDNFAFEFTCGEADCNFTFDNFTPFYKNINVGYSFDDSRVEEVEFSIQDQEGSSLNWTKLTKDVPVKASVVGGNFVKYRFKTTTEAVGSHEFKLSDAKIGYRAGNQTTYVFDGARYVEFAFEITELQFDETKEFNLVVSINA